MAFNNLFVSLRKIGRSAVLPVDKIKNICKGALQGEDIKTVLDFGSGTLFWSRWFVQDFKTKVYAVDVYYSKETMPPNDNIAYYVDVADCLKENNKISLVGACDVLHHLEPSSTDNFLREICGRTNIVVIKDIDANHKFGNFMNRMHDRIINGETISNIYPKKIKSYLESCGFEVSYHFIPKLWYPHFLLIAARKTPQRV